MTTRLIGIDVGTSSSKGVACGVDGQIVAEARVAHSLSVPRPGWAEQDADAIWWADVVAISRRLLAELPAGDTVGAIGVSAIGPCLLPLDDDNRPLRPGILYGIDTRATSEIAALEARHGRNVLEAFSGMGLSSQAVGPKIAWLRAHEPDVFARARRFVSASSYIIGRLTGEFVIDAHTASHSGPLFDPTTVAWSDRFADGITPTDRLARIGWSNELAGVVGDAAAAETGLSAGTPVSVGAVDALAEAVSVGVTEPGDVMIMYGSTIFLIAVLDGFRPAGPLWITPGATPGTWTFAAGLATSGLAMAWFRDRLAPELVAAERSGGRNAYAALEDEASASDPGSKALLFLPYLSGERTPIQDPLARGVVAGLSLATTRGDLYRALLEGIACAVRANLDAMANHGAELRRIVAVGGGTANRLALQLVSDVAGVEQLLPERTVGASLGDAFLAGVAAGLVEPAALARDWVAIRETIRPVPAASGSAAIRSARFHQLYLDTMDVVHALSSSGAGGP